MGNGVKNTVMEGHLTSGDEHTMRYTDDVLQNCTPEAYRI